MGNRPASLDPRIEAQPVPDPSKSSLHRLMAQVGPQPTAQVSLARQQVATSEPVV